VPEKNEYTISFIGYPITEGIPPGWDITGDTFKSESISIYFYDDPSNKINTSRGCAIVTVLINIEPVDNKIIKQQINSRGYNLGSDPSVGGTGCPATGPRTVERAMRVTYE
jgi:hypothetical protein